jgi:hypothetical protein
MSAKALLVNPAVSRAILIGVFGGACLAFTLVYSRRGPLVLPVYGALLAALTLLLARYPTASYVGRFVAALSGLCVASGFLYVTVAIDAGRGRQRLVAEGRLPASALEVRLGLIGHGWRILLLLAVSTLASAAVAFVSG